jgi:flagellar biosynthesis component FlhA
MLTRHVCALIAPHAPRILSRSFANFSRRLKAKAAPVLVISQNIGPFVRGIAERFREQTPVLSQGEIHPRAPQNRKQGTRTLGRSSPGEGRVTKTALEHQ